MNWRETATIIAVLTLSLLTFSIMNPTIYFPHFQTRGAAHYTLYIECNNLTKFITKSGKCLKITQVFMTFNILTPAQDEH